MSIASGLVFEAHWELEKVVLWIGVGVSTDTGTWLLRYLGKDWEHWHSKVIAL